MPKFTQLLKEAGVDSPHNFMVVGLRGSNLVGLRDIIVEEPVTIAALPSDARA